MSPGAVVLLAFVLSLPALHGLLTGSIGADTAGIRILLAVVAAVVVERLTSVFLGAIAKPPARAVVRSETVDAAPADEQVATNRRRRTDT